MNEETIISEGGLTRREMLKKSALVGAVAWAAPVVSSFSTPAFAQVTVSPASCTDWVCGETPDNCGFTPGAPNPECLCDVDVNGDPFCWQNLLCSASPACTTNADCPPGWRCTTQCCGQTCLPPCGTIVTGEFVQGALTAAG